MLNEEPVVVRFSDFCTQSHEKKKNCGLKRKIIKHSSQIKPQNPLKMKFFEFSVSYFSLIDI